MIPELELDEYAVHVWRIQLDIAPAVVAALHSVLGAEECGRAERLVFGRDRRRFVVAHGAARMILALHLGEAPETISWRRGRQGKPELAGRESGPRCNLTHSGELALLAVTRRRPVGIDLERLRADLPADSLAARFYPPAEAELTTARPATQRPWTYLRLWTRKEACAKAAGGRLAEGLGLPVAGDASAGASMVVRNPSGALSGPWRVCDLPVPAGYVAAVALAGERPYRIVQLCYLPLGGTPCACCLPACPYPHICARSSLSLRRCLLAATP